MTISAYASPGDSPSNAPNPFLAASTHKTPPLLAEVANRTREADGLAARATVTARADEAVLVLHHHILAA